MGNDLRAELAPRLEQIETAIRMLFDGYAKGSPSILREAMEYSLFSGGKRLRPMLCGLACEAVGGQFEQSHSAGVALEMIHTYSLIHDDLPAMDDDDLRRGRPTCHKVYGDALAILAGDGLQAMAFQVIASCYPPLISSVMMKELAKGSGAAGMVGGQVLDLIAEGRIEDRRSKLEGVVALESIHRLKTGALIRSSLLLGDFAALEETEFDGAYQLNDARYTFLIEYATAFGLLFQVTDDLLDAEGSQQTTGKKTGKDAAKGKLTYPGLLGIEASRAKAAELAQTCVSAAERFGERGRLLAELARFVERRDR